MGKDKRPSPEEMLVAAATDIHNDNCTLMARLADPDFDPATGLDCTLNGALEHIMALYERLLLFPQGFVPYEKVDFMVESTNALISAVERRYRLASAHKAGQAFRESLRWWHTTNEFHAMPHEAYKKHMIDSREGFIAALREFNCELFKSTIPQPAPAETPPGDQPSNPPPKRKSRSAATKADLRTAVKTILRGEDVNIPKPGPRLTAAKRRQIAAAEKYKKTHCGCTLHNACLRSFVFEKGGYSSGKSLYRVMKRMNS